MIARKMCCCSGTCLSEHGRRAGLKHVHLLRPNVRTAVCNEKVPGKEDMPPGWKKEPRVKQ